ncbi:MAG TPA: WXG100 family type VII secretion target [Jatrophihabitantaceae bacterium]|jgi:uncharacterized protein YukE
MANIEISYTHVKEARDGLRQGKEYLEQQLNQTSGEIRNLTAQAGGFKTDLAAPAFYNSFMKWREGMMHMVGGLDGMAQRLDQVVQAHQELDQSLGGAAGA